jgi:type I restriction enzyme, S subunit
VTLTTTWKTYKLGELAQYINGKAFKPDDWKSSGLPIIRIQNLTDRSKAFNYCDPQVEERYIINDGDLLISWSATLGSFIWDRGPAALNQHIFKVIPNPELINRDFLHFLILETLDEIASHAHGIAMKHITKKKFEAIEVLIPTLPEQSRIVARIKECLERVEEIENLHTYAEVEAAAVLPSVLNEVFTSQACAAPIQTIGEIATETRYGTSQKCHTESVGMPILRIPNVAQGAVNFDNLKFCSLNEKDQERINLQHGDLLFVRTNGSRDLVGRSAVFEGDSECRQFGFASYLIRVRVDQAKVLPRYLAYFLNSTNGRSELDSRRRTSAGQFNINSENLRSIPLPVPSLAEQERLLIKLEQREKQSLQLVAELRDARSDIMGIREAIYRKAFAGEL